jgi:RHS repeat-associated protein/uncharacterized repeat protein (TIGR01451 family)
MYRQVGLLEKSIRIFLVFIFCFSAAAPTPAVARAWFSNSAGSGDPLSEEGQPEKVNRSLPLQPMVFETPPYPEPDINERRTDPAPDSSTAGLPPARQKDEIEFRLIPSKGDIAESDTITLTAIIKNNSSQPIYDLVYSDALEDGFSYLSSSSGLATFSPASKEVSAEISSLNPGEEITIEYRVSIADNDKKADQARVWVHFAELQVGGSKSPLKAKATLRIGETDPAAESRLEYLDINGGWVDLDEISVYFPQSAVLHQGVVVQSKEEKDPRGPEQQFTLRLFQTERFVKEAGKIKEQKVKVNKRWENAFLTPVFLEIEMDGFVDLNNIPAGKEPYVATYDAEHDVWVKVPILAVDLESNRVTVKAKHFSTWGAGLGDSLPQNGANVLLFDQPYTSLFTGSSRYAISIWTPPGRQGMQPDITLSYSSATVDGVLGDVQSPWVGAGWNIDGIEIVRKITTDQNGYGYENDFSLTLNGVLYELIRDDYHPNRYYTERGSFLYIERHNHVLGNAEGVQNTAGEWWEVVATDGTRYRLGFNQDSEQLALMYGYSCTIGSPCNTPNGAYASLGYAGIAEDLVAMRWRVDTITDIRGNYITYGYAETQPDPVSLVAPFDRESYLEVIRYTGFDDGEVVLQPGYQVIFILGDRDGTTIPANNNVWDHFDQSNLIGVQAIRCEGSCDAPGALIDDTVVREYEFEYAVLSDSFAGDVNATMALERIKVYGLGDTTGDLQPDIVFTYSVLDNRDDNNGNQNAWGYPRLASINNGYDGILQYTYENDDRDPNQWYHWRVAEVEVSSGADVAGIQKYTYASPEYAGNELIGYTETTETRYEFDGTTPILATKHIFGMEGLDVGRELNTEIMDPATSEVLRKSVSIYVTDNSHAPFDGWNYRYLGQSEYYQRMDGALQLITKSSYIRDGHTGNLVAQFDYLGGSLARKQFSEYRINTDPAVYLLGTLSRTWLQDPSNYTYADTRFHYDGGINQKPQVGNLTLAQTGTGNSQESVDVGYSYDRYGNLTDTYAYKDYGTFNLQPTGLNQHTSTAYETVYYTYPATVVNAVNQTMETVYSPDLGLPISVTDINGLVTTTTYDGIGRVLTVSPPTLTQAGITYEYPVPSDGSIAAPYAVKMSIYDQPANTDRAVWGIYDGLGRILQTQVEAGTNLLHVSFSEFNAQGLVARQSVVEEFSGTGGAPLDPSQYQLIFTETEYDLLGRAERIEAPGGQVTLTSYNGLKTTLTNPAGQKTTRVTDGFGRLTSVLEFINGGQELYSSIQYGYDAAGRLVQVRDVDLNTTTIQYDWLGRKIGMQDPDMGTWTYGYDSLGNLREQTDAEGNSLGFDYDDLNRLIERYDADTDQTLATFTYDVNDDPEDVNIGKRTGMTDQTGLTALWEYSNNGLTVTETRGGFSMETTVDWLGRLQEVVYGDGETITYTYDALGRPVSMASDEIITPPENDGDLLVDLAYNVLGQVTSATLGNGAVLSNAYGQEGQDLFRLANRTVVFNNQDLLNFEYTYDPIGNITQIKDHVLVETIDYEYDDLNRLVSAEAVSNTETEYFQLFNYDQLGNITNVVDYTTDGIFRDGFEDGTLNNWDVKAIDGGDLAPSSESAFMGEFGMHADFDDIIDQYVRDSTPEGESTYRARFFFNPNSVTLPSIGNFVIFRGNDITNGPSFLVQVMDGNPYQIRLGLREDSTNWVYSEWVTIQDDWMSLEFEFRSSLLDGAGTGYFKLWVDGELATAIENADNDNYQIDHVFFGAISIESGSSGRIYLDEFESRRATPIGTVSDGGESGPDRFFESAGEVVMEAEHYTGTVPGTGSFANHTWSATTALAGYVGDSAMQTQPNTGGNTLLTTDGPALTYTIDFSTAGTYYVYVRMRGDSNADSVHVGIDGTAVTTSSGTGLTGCDQNAFSWQNHSNNGSDTTITIPAAGIYTFYLWMREDGVAVDRIWLSTTQDAVANDSTSTGPAESARQVSSVSGDPVVLNSNAPVPAGFRAFWINFKKGVSDFFLAITAGPHAGLSADSYLPLYAPLMDVTPTAAPTINAQWHFDENTGTTAYDSANDSDLALQSGVTWTSDAVSGSAIHFNAGINDWASAGDNPNLRPGNGFTLSLWIKPDDYPENFLNGSTDEQNTSYVLFRGRDNYSYGINLSPDGIVEFQLLFADTQKEKIEGPRLPLGEWAFVTAVYDPVTDVAELYVNGIKVAGRELDDLALDYYPWKALRLGGDQNGNRFKGTLDEITLYGRPLSAEEILDRFDDFTAPTPTPTPTPTATPTPTPAAPTGDGTLTIAAQTTFNLNVHGSAESANGSQCADGIAFSVVELAAGWAELNTAPGSCLLPGDEVLLINLMGTQTRYLNVGRYEFLRVQSIDNQTVTFEEPKIGFYGEETDNDYNIGVNGGQQRVMLMRVPNYSSLTINGTLTASRFTDERPFHLWGVIAFRVNGTLSGTGTILADKLGYYGGAGGEAGGDGGYQGWSYLGAGGDGSAANGGGGGGGVGSVHGSAGGGGGYGTPGYHNVSPQGGDPYGSYLLEKAFLGSGGGGGGTKNGSEDDGGPGGFGGGIVLVYADLVDFSGLISAKGEATPLNGGEGAGGTIRIESPVVDNIGSISAIGGMAGDEKGDGGFGRVAIYTDEYGLGTYSSDPIAYTGIISEIGEQSEPPEIINYNPAGSYGDGADGSIIIPFGETINLHTTNVADFHACGDGGDAVDYNVISLTNSWAQLSVSPLIGCLEPGDEILLINMMGTASNYVNTGKYEYLRVGGIVGDKLYFSTPKMNYYGASAFQDDDIGVGTGEQRVVVQRVPNYSSVTIEGTLTASSWNGKKGGILAFRVADVLTGDGLIELDGKGYKGGEGGEGGGDRGNAGSSYLGIGPSQQQNYGGGGGGGTSGFSFGRAGGGGGYGTEGESVLNSGFGGEPYGIHDLSTVFLGSGGGGGASKNVDGSDPGFPGSSGGGALILFASTLDYSGTISANGLSESGNGGNGSGGTIRLESDDLTIDSLSVSGGIDTGGGGDGGDGRVAVFCATSLDCSLPAGYSGYVEYLEDPQLPFSLEDGFEYGSLDSTSSPWDVYTNNPDLSISQSGKRTGDYGLVAVANDTEDLWVREELGGEKEFHARVYINPEEFAFGQGEALEFLRLDGAAYWGIATVQLTKTTSYELQIRARKDDLNFENGSWIEIGDGWTAVEIAWKAASYDGANDGYLELYIDGQLVSSLTNLDNDSLPATRLYLGTYGLEANSSGTLYLDDFKANNLSYIGLDETAIVINPPAEGEWLENQYTYSGTKPHAVTKVVREQIGGGSITDKFVYDLNGNMTCRFEAGQVWQQVYNVENRLAEIHKMAGADCSTMGSKVESWFFYYDGDGVRIKEEYDADGDGVNATITTRLFLFGGSYEISDYGGVNEEVSHYYSIAGMRVAMRDDSGVYYFASDHLSSASLVMDNSGTALINQRFEPFGQLRENTGTLDDFTDNGYTDFGFTGQRAYLGQFDSAGFGLMDYNARFYSPTLGRFIQPDSIIPDMTNSQAWNRYAYTLNNPVIYSDPSGHFPIPWPLVLPPFVVALILGGITGYAIWALTPEGHESVVEGLLELSSGGTRPQQNLPKTRDRYDRMPGTGYKGTLPDPQHGDEDNGKALVIWAYLKAMEICGNNPNCPVWDLIPAIVGGTATIYHLEAVSENAPAIPNDQIHVDLLGDDGQFIDFPSDGLGVSWIPMPEIEIQSNSCSPLICCPFSPTINDLPHYGPMPHIQPR